MEKIFVSTENSKKNESYKLFISLLTKLIIKLQVTKISDWFIYVFTKHAKTLNLHKTTINSKFQL